MQFFILAALALGAAASPARPSSGSTICYTQLTSTSCKTRPQTTWSTSWYPLSTTITKTVTVTPKASTSIVVSTVTTTTTAPTTTFVATSTSSITSTVTTTSTSTSTLTSTASTSTVSTSTVPAGSAFTPIQSSLPGSSYSGDEGTDPIKRDAKLEELQQRAATAQPIAAASYPYGYQCWMYSPTVKTITATSTKYASTPVVTSTTTSTITSTIYPSATTTTTVSSFTTTTLTSFTSTTVTSTTTTTSVSSTTVYAACASNNLADTYNGSGVNSARTSGSFLDASASASNAYDCCVAALTAGETGAEFFVYGGKQCYFSYTGNTCSAQSDNVWYLESSIVYYAYGNLGCGLIDSVSAL